MTFSLNATAEPTHAPPRVKLEVAESEPTNMITSLVLYRDGVKLRFEPVITGAGSALVYDYDAPFDVALAYRAEGTEAGVTLDWTEAWPDLADWLSPYGIAATGWSVAGGVATSTGSNSIIYRDTTDNIARVEVVNPSNVTVALADDTDFQVDIVSVRTSPDGFVTVTSGGGTTFTDESGDVRFIPAGGTVVAGTGSYVINLTDTSVSVVGDTWSATVPLRHNQGITQVRVIGPPEAAVYLSQFGTYGTGDGQFFSPRSIAVDSSGNTFVADHFNNRVQKFDPDGVYLSQFGTGGTGNGQFDHPRGIVIDASDNIFVVDSGNERVQKFNSAGVYQSQFGTDGTGNGQFTEPSAIAIDGSGNMWVTDELANRVQKFNSSGVYQSQFGSTGTGNGQFTYPNGIALDSSGNIFVADSNNNRVQKFNSSGTYQSQFGTLGSGDGQFAAPYGIVIDASDNIWVSENSGHRVQKFNSAGVYQAKFGTYGAGNGQFVSPLALAFDDDDLYVVDNNNSRIQKFTTQSGSVEDITTYIFDDSFLVAASDTETLTPTGDAAGVWLVNAAQPELSILAEHEPLSSDAEYFIVPTTRVGSELKANSVALAIEGSADIVTVAVGPRRRETWTLDIACTTESARQTLIALLGDSAAVNLRMPSTDRWSGLVPGFYAVGDVSSERRGHPQLGPIVIISLPLTPSRAPAYLSLWQWNMRALAQTGMTMADVSNAYPTMLDLLVGPA